MQTLFGKMAAKDRTSTNSPFVECCMLTYIIFTYYCLFPKHKK
jgi:hypothetical protein